MKKSAFRHVALVMPPQLGLLEGFSSGLISIANYVQERFPQLKIGIHDLSHFDREQACDYFAETVPWLGADCLVGITATTACYQAALRVARECKRISPDCTVVLGGHHASGDSENILRYHGSAIDAVFIGEGERSLCEFLSRYPDLSLVPGVAYIEKGLFKKNPPSDFLTQEDLDQLPITFNNGPALGTPGKFNHITYVSARGCPLQCAFCSVANERIRAKSVTQVMSDIRMIVNSGFTQIAFEDNFFAQSPKRTREICRALAQLRKSENLEFSWDCQTRVESLMSPEIMSHLTEAGCDAVYVGVESVVDEHLIYLNKTRNPSTYLSHLTDKVVPALLDSTLDCYINLQFGIPNEQEHHYQRTLHTLSQLGSTAESKNKVITVFPQLHVVYPGTTHFYQGVYQGRFGKAVFETFTKWESEKVSILEWLGQYFAHGAGGLPEGILDARKLKEDTYVIDTDAVMRISAFLMSLDQLAGVRLFQYGNYLAASN